MRVYKEHLNAAWGLVQRGSPAAGVDGVTVELFGNVWQEQMVSLRRQLQREIYAASPAKGFFVRKKSGGQRLIGLSTVRDRIVQRYLLQGMYPKLEKAYYDSAFAYRPGRSIYTAVDRIMARYQFQPAWVAKVDIQQFFDNLSWPLLIHQMEQLRLHPTWIRLVEEQLKAGVMLSGQFYRPNKGVLQGGILSGALANLYLTEFDRRCLEAEIPLVRYGDDCVAVFHSYLQASRSLELMHDWIEDLYLPKFCPN
ncbi:MAG: reverse transcriptase domain-containing protein [Cyanobacteria bacterium J06626_6]